MLTLVIFLAIISLSVLPHIRDQQNNPSDSHSPQEHSQPHSSDIETSTSVSGESKHVGQAVISTTGPEFRLDSRRHATF